MLSNRASIIQYKKTEETRGWFQKPLTGLIDPELNGNFGEIYSVKALPGEFRGNHYHEKATEWFFVVAGEATVYLKDVDSGETMSLKLCETDNSCLKICPRVAHAFVNQDSALPFVLVAYTNRLFDPLDTIPLEVPRL